MIEASKSCCLRRWQTREAAGEARLSMSPSVTRDAKCGPTRGLIGNADGGFFYTRWATVRAQQNCERGEFRRGAASAFLQPGAFDAYRDWRGRGTLSTRSAIAVEDGNFGGGHW